MKKRTRIILIRIPKKKRKSIYDELPDAPPKKRIKLSWVGKTSVAIVALWIVIAFIGPFIAPYHEADMAADDSFMPGDSDSCWVPTI